MAKSKSGGTRSYIRGRVGADVYSIGRDAGGKKQQVVRSLAETVANPQTQNQMRGRMIMSTIMQVVAALKPIVDHSFDNVTGKQPNLSEFIRRNYSLIKADIAANPASSNKFGLSKYGEKGAKQGQYVISDGQAALPSALVLTQATGAIAITMAADAVTIAGLKAALGMTSEEYFTLVGIGADGKGYYERFRINPSLADETAISAANIADVFGIEGNASATIAIASNVISITLASVAGCCAVIISKKTANGYIHNEATLGGGTGFDFNANAALPTYPVGSADYLNGGDIFGQQESFNGGDTPAPGPSPTQSAISRVTVNGASLAQAAAFTLNEGTNAVVVTINPGTDGASYGLAVIDTATAVIGQSVAAGSQTAVSSTSVNLSVTGVVDGAAKRIVLCRANLITQVWGTLNQPAAAPAGEFEMTSLTADGTNILPQAYRKYFNPTHPNLAIVFGLNNTPTAADNVKVGVSANMNLSVGSQYPSGQTDLLSEALESNSGTMNLGDITNQNHRVYLVVAGNVAQVCGYLEFTEDE